LSRLVRFASWFACGASNSSLSGGRSAGTGTGLMVKRSCGLDAASWYAWHDMLASGTGAGHGRSDGPGTPGRASCCGAGADRNTGYAGDLAERAGAGRCVSAAGRDQPDHRVGVPV
jgi:hypothetical protein